MVTTHFHLRSVVPLIEMEWDGHLRGDLREEI